jgi:hypothetical protein
MFFSFLFSLLFLSGEIPAVQSVARRLSSVLFMKATKSKAIDHHPSPEHVIQEESPLEKFSSPLLSKDAETRDVDLWIVGCGKLGMLVAKKWLELHPTAVVVGETMSTSNHHSIAQLGATPRLRGER